MAKEKKKTAKKQGATGKSVSGKAKAKKASSKNPAPKKKITVKSKTAAKTKKIATVKKKAIKKPKRKSETLMCFLTTACVNYYSLPDNGYELTTLRHYRDTYLAASTGGKKLIKEYYRISPEIVKLVNKDKERKSVYAYIYAEVLAACSNIEKQNLLAAKKVYTAMVNTLIKRYALR